MKLPRSNPPPSLPHPPTPAQLGFSMPAEWELHDATWLAWPTNQITWPHRLVQIEAIYLKMIEMVSQGEIVNILVNDAETALAIPHQFLPATRANHVHFHVIPTVDAWIRDYGPTFVKRVTPQGNEIAMNNWRFNAWGEKYHDLLKDNEVNEEIKGLLDYQNFEPDIVLEGGSIEVNGKGTCLVTEQCLLNPNRNPVLSRHDIETYLQAYLGVSHVIWLGEGVEGDDTDGHIDDIARFVSPTTIVCVTEENPHDPNYPLLQDNFSRLQAARDQEGKPFNIIPLPMPCPIQTDVGRLPASYANFYIANHAVLVPIFEDRHDQAVLDMLTSYFPDRKVIGIPCRALVWGLGAIHCVTQQQPAAT